MAATTEPSTLRGEVLDQAREAICHSRVHAYGSPESSFTKIANLWNIYLKRTIIKPHDVAIMMALLKIARLMDNPQHKDSWVDLVGYGACGAQVAQNESQSETAVPGSITPVSSVPR